MIARAPARRLPLRGADLVLIAMHRLWGGERLSNNTTLVVECARPIQADRLRDAFARFLDVCPWPAARLRRPFPWGKLHWAAGERAALVAPPVGETRLPSRAALQTLVEAELAAVIDPRREPPLRATVVELGGGAGTPAQAALVMTWFHPLMDPRGGENLIGHLAHLDQRCEGAPWDGRPPAFVSPRERRPLQERGRLARRSVDHMRTLMSGSPVSAGTGLARVGPPRFRQATFVPSGPDRRDLWSRLTAVGCAMAELWRRRGLADVPFLVPVSIDLRAKGEREPTFGNALAFHFARFKPSDTTDPAGCERALRRQFVDAMRDDLIEANAVAMEFLHYRPTWMMLRDLPGTASRETFSFNCADVGEFPPAVGSIFGSQVVNAWHVPAVLPRPGIGVFFNRCAGRWNLVVSFIEGVVSEDEVARVIEIVARGMGWTRAI